MSTIGESIIIFGFPGVGKSYAFEHQDELDGVTLQDSDSSHFHWLYKDDEFKEPVLDEDGKKVVHPDWPHNYAQYIELTGREQKLKPDYIMVSTHSEVMKTIGAMDFTSFTIVPSVDLKDRYLKLYKDRGSSQEFIDNMDKNWEKFIKEIWENSMTETCNNMVVEIREGGRIQNVWDLVSRKIGIPMEFFDEK